MANTYLSTHIGEIRMENPYIQVTGHARTTNQQLRN